MIRVRFGTVAMPAASREVWLLCFATGLINLMSFGGGQIVTAYGYRPVFLIGAALSASSAALMWQISRRLSPAAHALDAGAPAAGAERS